MGKHNVYISHAWGGESEQIVQEIYKRCQKVGLNIILDRKDLEYRQSISSFMQELGKADAIILVVSNKYLHSEYCMFELLQIYENKNMIQRIFPIVLDEVSIAKSVERLDLVKYWENETENLESRIRELKNLSYIEGITEDLNLYQKIRSNIANLTRILKDINTLNIKLHKDNDYTQLIDGIRQYLERNGSQENVPVASHIPGDAHSGSSRTPPKSEIKESLSTAAKPTSWWSKIFRILPYIIVMIVGMSAIYIWNGYTTKSIEPDRADMIGLNEMDRSTQGIPESHGASESTAEMPREVVSGQSKSSRTPDQGEVGDPSVPSQDVAVRTVLVNDSGQKDKTQLPSDKSPIGRDSIIDISPARNVNLRLASENDGDPIAKAENPHGEEKEETVPRTRTLFVPESKVAVQLLQDISSNSAVEGEEVYLSVVEPVEVDAISIAEGNARVKARVIDAKASQQGSRASLGIRLEGLELTDGQWLNLQYHDILERRRGEIVFKAGTVLENVIIKPANITLKVTEK